MMLYIVYIIEECYLLTFINVCDGVGEIIKIEPNTMYFLGSTWAEILNFEKALWAMCL